MQNSQKQLASGGQGWYQSYMDNQLDSLGERPFPANASLRSPACVGEPDEDTIGAASPSIYFIQVGSDGPIKIGIALDVRARLNTLQVANHEKLHLLHSIAGCPLAEKHMHDKWRAHWIRGEWFHPAPEILQFLRRKGAEVRFTEEESNCRKKWRASFKAEMLDRAARKSNSCHSIEISV